MEPLLKKTIKWREVLREVLFPLGCVLCGKKLHADSAYYGLCDICRKALVIPHAERGRCSLCGQPLISEKETCMTCRNSPQRSFDRIISLYPYMGKYKKILKEYKFNKRLSIGNFFTEKLWTGLGMLLSTLCIEEPISDIGWVPVPPRQGKIKETGWDQIEYLAALLENDIRRLRHNFQNQFSMEKIPSINLCPCLKRLPSESQKELNKENRLQNLKGRILINDGQGFHRKKNKSVPKTAVLFDDVYTTGATMETCAFVLKSAGAEHVYGICLFYD